jgi:hypothetical protein
MTALDLRGAIRAHLDSHQVARVVYGAIIGLALVAALELHPPGAGTVIGLQLATAVAVALAEIYSEVLGSETRLRRRATRADLGHFAQEGLAVAFGIAFPVVFFVLAAAGVMETDTAFTVAKWSGAALIGFYGYCAAKLAGEGFVDSMLHACAVLLIGLFVIALKALLH